MFMPTGWPSMHKVHKNLPTVSCDTELFCEMENILKNRGMASNNLESNRFGFLTMGELLLKYHAFMTEEQVKKLSRPFLTKLEKMPDMSEYRQLFVDLLHRYTKSRVERKVHTVLCLSDFIGADCARSVAGLV